MMEFANKHNRFIPKDVSFPYIFTKYYTYRDNRLRPYRK